jgi:uncharacterized protein YcbK (DUF882 family)
VVRGREGIAREVTAGTRSVSGGCEMNGNVDKPSHKRISRRRMLQMSVAATATILVPGIALADDWIKINAVPLTSAVSGRSSIMRWRPNANQAQPHYQQPHYEPARYTPPTRSYSNEARSLAMYNPHTGESVNLVYCEKGYYVPGALQEINYFFRDFRANLVKPIDPRLLDLLHAIHQSSDATKPFNLVSGYRSPQTNAMLAAQNEGVARHSMHIEGKAADINLPGRQLSILQRIALALRFGGVGYYPQSGFVHVDTGRIRRWG